jgi:hypothetical protein
VEISVAIADDEIESCFPAFQELRPHLSQDSFVAQVQRQMKIMAMFSYISPQTAVWSQPQAIASPSV